MHWKRGDIIKVPFGSRILEAIVIDPDGLATGQPSIGMSLTKVDKHVGIPQNTLSDWVIEIDACKWLKLPSGSTFRVIEIEGNDGNTHFVVEICDWMTLAADLVKYQGKVRKTTINKVVDFMAWFAVDGFYAQAYVMLGIVYGQRTHRRVESVRKASEAGIVPHCDELVHQCGCQWRCQHHP